MQFKMKHEKVHELEQKFQAKVKRLNVFPIWKKISTKMKQEKVHQLQEKFQTKVEKSTMLQAFEKQKKKQSIKTKPKQQKLFYELYDETGKSSENFKSKSREVDRISNINNIHENISPC